MYFPNADVVVHPALLVFLGVIVGMLGGFFGVGGGFLITGGLLVFGVPPVYAVGTGLTLVMGTSIINTFKHRSLGNVDFKLGALMVTGTIPAIFLAEWVNASLEAAGIAGPVIRYIYVGFLSVLGLFILYDYWRTSPMRSQRRRGGPEQISTLALTHRVRSLRIPPHRIGIPGVGRVSTYVSLPVSGYRAHISLRAGEHWLRNRVHRRDAGRGRRVHTDAGAHLRAGHPHHHSHRHRPVPDNHHRLGGEFRLCPVGPRRPDDGGADAGGGVHRFAAWG